MGYNAIQLAYCPQPKAKLTKPQLGHLQKSGGKAFKAFGEFRIADSSNYTLGQTLNLDLFTIGQKVSSNGKEYW